MANAATGNLFYIDNVPKSISVKNLRVVGIIVYCTHATQAAYVEIGDDNSGTSYPTVLTFAVAAADQYAHIDLGNTPLVFPNGLRVKTLNNGIITLILDKTTGNS
jgi:hypothetical protein